ncbi:MAG: ABC transporter permease [Reyranellaceae bacterium]
MATYVFQRLVVSFPVLLGVLLIGFLLLQVVPSDPVELLAGPEATDEVRDSIRRELGLDRPLHEQFFSYLARVAQGDLGRSLISNRSVAEELWLAIPPTAELAGVALLWAIPAGLGLGTLAAIRRGSLVDRCVMALSVTGLSVPVFFLGLMLIRYVGFEWQLLPFVGRPGPIYTLDGLLAIVLPAATLGGILVGPIARMTRTTTLEVLRADYVRTARAKGVAELRVVLAHVLRTALIPIVTLIGLQAAFLLGGAVVTETLFAWPGLGLLAVGAILSRDFPLAQGAIMILALAFIVINLAVDLLYTRLDPRVRRR